jgi:hypothetical protein
MGPKKDFLKKTLVKNFTMMQFRPRFAGCRPQGSMGPVYSRFLRMSNAID